MIIINQHQHNPQQAQAYPTSPYPTSTRKMQFMAKEQSARDLQQILLRSSNRLHDSIVQLIQKKRMQCQNKVYLILQQQPADYLSILVKQQKYKIMQLVPLLDRVIERRENKVLKDLNNQKLQLKAHPQGKSIQQLKRQLNLKISSIKDINSYYSYQQNQQIKNKKTQIYKNKKYYKNGQSLSKEQLQKLNKFIIMSSRQRKKRYQIYIKNNQLKQKQRQLLLQKEEEQKNKKQKQKIYTDYLKIKKQKQLKNLQEKQKKEETQKFLGKFKSKSPAHIYLAQKFHKKQQQYAKKKQQFLCQLSSKKRHSSLLEIRQRAKMLQKNKEKYQQQKLQQMQMQNQEQIQIKNQLNNLFKSQKYDRQIREQLSKSMTIKHEQAQKLKQNKKKLLKMALYDGKTKKQYLPRVDSKKKQDLLRSIQKLNIMEDNKIVKKFRSGQLITIKKDELNNRLLGIKYLQQLKEMLSSMPRKTKQDEKQTEIKLVDRSLLKNNTYKKRQTMHNWRHILQDNKLDLQGKQKKLKDYCKLIEQQQKVTNRVKVKSSLSKSIDLQQKMDKCEIQKIQAKLALLKSYN